LPGSWRTKPASSNSNKAAIASEGDATRYFTRFGFAPASSQAMLQALAGSFLAEFLRQRPDELARLRILSLDISNDGVIMR